jgi:hypothetical protein
MSADARLGLGVAMRLIYDSRANATDKAVLVCIAHAGDWCDVEAERAAAAGWVAKRLGMARSTVLASLARLRTGGVIASRRTGHANQVSIAWDALKAFESKDGHVGGPRTKRGLSALRTTREPVDNSADSVDSVENPPRRPATGHREMTDHRSPDDRPPVTRRPTTGHQMTDHRSHTNSFESTDRSHREREGSGERVCGHVDNVDVSPAPIPAWMAKQAREADVLPIELLALVETVADHLHPEGPVRRWAVEADGPAILRMWDTLGRPDPMLLAKEMSLVADAFHAAPGATFARFVRNEGGKGSNNATSVSVLCQVERWTERLSAARAWDLAGRPDKLSGRKS